MVEEYSRAQRVGDFLQRELAMLVQGLSDPRLGMVSITGVDISNDLGHAKVYFTTLNDELKTDAERTASVLNRASGFLRKGLSETAGLRNIPKLTFYFDDTIAHARHLNTLIHKANNCSRSSSEH